MNARYIAAGLLVIVAIGAAVVIWRARQEPLPEAAQVDSGRQVLYWYDPMVPQTRFDKPGKSPFMDMQLVPKYADESQSSGVKVAPTVQQNLGIRLARAERSRIGNRITAVGRVEVNERALNAVPSRVSGYVERLRVRAVGDPVKRGQLLAQIYSGDLLSAQNEFLALRNAQDLSERAELTAAARARLRLLGMAPSEIDALERSGEAAARFGVYAPVDGFVMELATREGGLIQSGATLMSIADLSTLWLIAEVPERDASAIQPGDAAVATFSSGTREAIDAKVDAVYPTLNTQSRTTRVRILLPNRDGVFRPGMLANVAISAAQREAITVPSEAVIYTGTRSVVIVQEGSAFRPTEVRVGGEVGNRTEILSGLSEGEQVVASGQFLIDSEASLSGVLARLSAAEPIDEMARDRADDDAVLRSSGEVTDIDHANGRVTLAHPAIPELQWPAMTMPFRVLDARALHSLVVGDRVSFSLRSKPQDGEYVIESIAKETPR